MSGQRRDEREGMEGMEQPSCPHGLTQLEVMCPKGLYGFWIITRIWIALLKVFLPGSLAGDASSRDISIMQRRSIV